MNLTEDKKTIRHNLIRMVNTNTHCVVTEMVSSIDHHKELDLTLKGVGRWRSLERSFHSSVGQGGTGDDKDGYKSVFLFYLN